MDIIGESHFNYNSNKLNELDLASGRETVLMLSGLEAGCDASIILSYSTGNNCWPDIFLWVSDNSAHPETENFPRFFVALSHLTFGILTICLRLNVPARLDSEQNISFLDRHLITEKPSGYISGCSSVQ